MDNKKSDPIKTYKSHYEEVQSMTNQNKAEEPKKILPEPDSYWREQFNQYFPASCSSDAVDLNKVKKNLEQLAAASFEMPNVTDGKAVIKKAIKQLAETPTLPEKLTESEWSLLLFGHALRSILELVGHYDARFMTDDEDIEESEKSEDIDDQNEELLDEEEQTFVLPKGFIAGQAFKNALQITLEDFTARLSSNPKRANTLRNNFLANPAFHNKNGWFILKYILRSYVEFIIARSGLVVKSEFEGPHQRKSRGIADRVYEISDDIKKSLQAKASYPKTNKPLSIPPHDWQQGIRGGKPFNPHHLVKLPPKNLLSLDYLQLIDGLEIPEIFQGLNFLQKTPWRINKRVLSVLQQVYTPADNIELGTELVQILKDVKEKEPKRYSEAKRIQNSDKPSSLIGSLLEEGNKFYYPYQLDYRGRIYPSGGWLTPQGDGLAKALLEFHQGKPMPPEHTKETDRAWLFLAVHGSQFISTAKIVNDLNKDGAEIKQMPTLEDRRKWIIKNNSNILESVKNPTINTWWLKAAKSSEAWQFLAFCFAWEDAINGKPSHLPVHVDGSCNGLQHMAALMRDRILAENTNLLHNTEQKDTYTWVLDSVRQRIEEEAKSSSSVWQPLAQWVISAGELLNRDVAKTVVMVFSYGSTDYGKKIQDYFHEEFINFTRGEAKNEETANWPQLLEILNDLRSKEVLKGAYKVQGWMHEGNEPSNKFTKDEVESWIQQQKGQSPEQLYFNFVKDLKPTKAENGNDAKEDLARERLTDLLYNSLAHYLANHFSQVMDEQLSSAVNLRKELLEWATLVSKATNLPVTWVSPMGMPVTQTKRMTLPNRSSESEKPKLDKNDIVESYFKGANIDWQGLTFLENSLKTPDSLPVMDDELLNKNKDGEVRRQIPEEVLPNVLKFKAVKKDIEETINIQARQKSSFVPNFIHSLDASHLMLTLNRSLQLDIDAFSAVHDSFGTHAVDMPKLARALRDTFILLHKKPLLKHYKQWFISVSNPDKGFNSLSSQIEGAVIGLMHNKWWKEAQPQQEKIAENAFVLPTHPNEKFDLDEIAKSEYIFF